MDDTTRGVAEIEADIQHTREELAETVEALQERLRPSNVIADATDRVKTATTEKVKSMAESASETMQGVMRETRDRAADVVDGVRQNPLPALMIGAGVAWLLMDKSKSTPAWSRDYVAGERQPLYSDVEYRTSGSRSGLGSDDSSSVVNRARSTAHEGYESARRTTYRAQNQLQRIVRDNPLLVGAAAVVVGAAVGAALPETERENELMGETRDSVVSHAQGVARAAASTVQEVAKDAVDEVSDRVKP